MLAVLKMDRRAGLTDASGYTTASEPTKIYLIVTVKV